MQRQDIPERIGRLDELAHNLWTSWRQPARTLFRALNYQLWRTSGHNPVRELYETSPERLRTVAADPTFLALYDAAIAEFDRDIANGHCWFPKSHPGALPGPVAYFSAEFAFHHSIPIYAGGLGVLTGDTIKEASDIALPVHAVGLMYPQGYFHQHLSAEGWQEETYEQLDFARAPMNECPLPQGCSPMVQIQLAERTLNLHVWLVRVGRVNVYLLDTNVEGNSTGDRQLSARLYSADREQRLQQEIVLGVGGVRVMRELGIEPSVWHGNEGHTSFMMLERVREEVERGAQFPEAVSHVRANTVFTTHTPVPAGHDTFSETLMEKYFHSFWTQMGVDRATFMQLGQQNGTAGSDFNMTILALRLAQHANGVSAMHGKVSRKMWHVLWPEGLEEDVPIMHITNGVHVPTWLSPEMLQLFERHLGADLLDRHDDATLWEKIAAIPNEEIWRVHLNLKRKLLYIIREAAALGWTEGTSTAQQVVATGALLDGDSLTIGFVRRFAEYKRPALLFQDIERLKRIVANTDAPVQIVFAGKSHPADFPSKHLLHQVYSMAMDRAFGGRIVFVEDLDTHLAHYLVQGVDVWLNNPRRLQEASGTSGMKAGMNGVLNLSDAAGWWQEAYNGRNGWLIGDNVRSGSFQDDDGQDATDLYHLIEHEVVPLFYRRDGRGIPHEWVRMMKESIRTILPAFSTRRMLKEYTEKMYLAAVHTPVR